MKRVIGFVILGIVIGVAGIRFLSSDSSTEDTSSVPAPQPIPEAEPPDPASFVETDPDVLTAPPPLDGSAPSDTPRYALEDAAARGLIEYEISGNDASSGDALVLAIRRLTDTDIDVYVVPGTVFIPANSGAQRMVAWNVARGVVVHQDKSSSDLGPVTSIYLPSAELRLYSVEAYCLDFDLENPTATDVFQPVLRAVALPVAAAVEPDVRAAQLVRRGKESGLSFRGIQVAIWADHNDKTKEEIASKFTVEDKEMNDAFQMLLNTPPPKKKPS